MHPLGQRFEIGALDQVPGQLPVVTSSRHKQMTCICLYYSPIYLVFARMTGIQALKCPQRSCCLRTQGHQRPRVAATRPKFVNRTQRHELRAAIPQAAVIEKEEGDREGGTGMYASTHRQWCCMAYMISPCTNNGSDKPDLVLGLTRPSLFLVTLL